MPSLQADSLSKAKELLFYKAPELLDQYLPLLLEFRIDNAAVVKLRVIEIVTEALQLRPQLKYLAEATGCIHPLLRDSVSSVVKAAVVGARSLLSVSLHVLCWAPGDEGTRQAADRQWQSLCSALETIQTLTGHSNPGVKMLTIKFLEQVVLLCSAEQCPGLRSAQPSVIALAAPLPCISLRPRPRLA